MALNLGALGRVALNLEARTSRINNPTSKTKTSPVRGNPVRIKRQVSKTKPTRRSRLRANLFRKAPAKRN